MNKDKQVQEDCLFNESFPIQEQIWKKFDIFNYFSSI